MATQRDGRRCAVAPQTAHRDRDRTGNGDDRSGGAGAPASASPRAGLGGGSGLTAIHLLGVLDILVVTVFVVRGLDVRMLLFLGALPLFLAASRPALMVIKMASEMANPATVVPICSAMGFAFVLRLTECDQHLVLLLVRPLRRMRLLLVPGGIAAGYLINTTIVSQAGTAAVLGPVLIPLLRAGGLGPAAAGAVLLLGSSMGGELFNPGAVEIGKLAELTKLAPRRLSPGDDGLNLLSCGVISQPSGFCGAGSSRAGASRQARSPARPTNRLPGLTSSSTWPRPSFRCCRSCCSRSMPWPAHIRCEPLPGRAGADPGRHADRRRRGRAWRAAASAAGLAAAFFEGAGYAYTHVISLIVAASTFAEGVELSGLIGLLIEAMNAWPRSALVVAPMASWFLAFVAGTGIAPAVAIMEFFVPAAGSMGLDPIRLGTVTSLAAHFGRTMSPAAAVVMMAARLSDAGPRDLIRRVAGPLLAGLGVLIARHSWALPERVDYKITPVTPVAPVEPETVEVIPLGAVPFVVMPLFGARVHERCGERRPGQSGHYLVSRQSEEPSQSRIH